MRSLEKATFQRSELGPAFVLGVATSAYQIEGGHDQEGRAPSIWDTFSHTPGKTKAADHGDVACDHYNRLEQDLDLLAWLGVDAYRFSIAWPRVLPAGRGQANDKGIAFYERLVDGLLRRGIKPCATLYHWDLPQALQDEGGWLARPTAEAFAEYADLMARRLGDRVAMWITHNEPWCQAFLGYETGLFAPGHQDFGEALQCAHHLLLSHGMATQALRSRVSAPVGIAPNYMPAHPATSSQADAAAAKRQDGYFNRWFIEPVMGRGYPEDMVRLYADKMPDISAADLTTIAQPIDFLGVNYYERAIVADSPGEGVLHLTHVKDETRPRTADREIYPEGIFETLMRLHLDYHVPRLVVTENGAAFDGEVTLDAAGELNDSARTDFLVRHLQQVARARVEGVPVDGYFAWSLMDNFEWAEGYAIRYGIVHVDFATQVRTPKQSAYFLRSLSEGIPAGSD